MTFYREELKQLYFPKEAKNVKTLAHCFNFIDAPECLPSWFSTALRNLLGSTRNWEQCVYSASVRGSLLLAHFSMYFLSFKLLRRQTFFAMTAYGEKISSIQHLKHFSAVKHLLDVGSHVISVKQ